MSTSEIALAPGPGGAPVAGAVPATPAGSVTPALAPVGGGPDAAQALGRMLERLANEYFAGVPGPALELGLHQGPGPLAVAGAPAPNPLSPPSGVFPAATSVGAGGVSPGAGWVPPTPGVLQSPPIASGPLPKESDLRTLPAMLSEGFGIASPVALAGAVEPSPEAAPHWLESVPPTPGIGQRVPFASGPLPGEPQTSAVTGSGGPGFSVPLGLEGGLTPPSPGDAPYFLSIAGLPKVVPSSASVPGFATSAPAIGGVSPGALGAALPIGAPPAGPEAAASAVPRGVPPSAGQPAPSSSGLAPNGLAASTSSDIATPNAPARAVALGLPANAAAPGNTPGAVDDDAVPIDGRVASRAGHSAFVPGGSGYSPSELSLLPHAFDTPAASGLAPRGGRRLFDPTSIRNDFPILKERVNGREVIWFDNAATTQKPRAVIDRISHFYQHENSNIHRAAHTLAARATDAYEGSRETVRRFINAPSVAEIIFARGTTEAINLVAQSWGRRHLHSGDEVLITWLEHHANIVPWQQICSERGARLKVAPVDDDGQVLLYEYEKLLGPRTKFVSMAHVSNALGTIVPVTEMVEMAHRHGATVLVDGAQAVSHMAVDVQAIGCDFYVFSGHKIFGPTGIGALFGRAEVLDGMPPWQGGGNMIRDVTFEKTQFQGAPARFEAGTPNIADAVGLGAALDYVSSLGIENISRYEHELLVYATERLKRISGLRLYGTAPDKAGVLSFTLEGLKTEDIGTALDREGIAVRAGHHCAQPVLRRFGQETTVRASLAPYNNHDDIDALVAALQRLRVMRY